MKILFAISMLAAVSFANVARADDHVPKAKPYPLETCFMSGEKLGEMGKPVTFDYKGQEIKLCCHDCEKEFKADPEKAMKKFEEAKKKAGK